MIIATVASGAFMTCVHPFAKFIPDDEYGVFGTLLATLNCMSIPSLGLQMSFVQQAAAAIDEAQKRRLRGMMLYRVREPDGTERLEECPYLAPLVTPPEYGEMLRTAGFEVRLHTGYEEKGDDGADPLLCFECTAQ